MSENTSEVSSSRHTTISSVPNHSTLISFNAAAQLSVKLTHENYTSWKAQWDALFYGYDLLGFISRIKPCPPETILENDNYVTNPDFILWMRQDKLLFHGITSSLSERVLPRATSAKSSAEAWDRLAKMYANASSSRTMGLTERLTNISRGTQSVADYLGTIQAIADDLAMIDQPVSNAHLVNHVLNGIGAEYKEISAAVRARDSIISFEELHDKLIDYGSYLKREESRNNASITANAARFSQPKYGNQGKKHNPSYSNNQSSGPGQRQTTLWTNNNNNNASLGYFPIIKFPFSLNRYLLHPKLFIGFVILYFGPLILRRLHVFRVTFMVPGLKCTLHGALEFVPHTEGREKWQYRLDRQNDMNSAVQYEVDTELSVEDKNQGKVVIGESSRMKKKPAWTKDYILH
ncbi:hypothetical protein Acr_13g0000220 [Actinidia rufa]|uniref:Retrotransposon Copia-like N-terminal domain-containing protein n=1 Tax=Actinidia rufa TaxID=165716 RepID=A0A7J0FIW1_9ERIC|nr:hypothetical protein Acr_13g0000220 [Actinidia rufa]